ncbi:PKD domain-containing protein [Glutamicibacter sp.]|uniref:PKD domain-containing protein n=1 Tax=Glutamicibacter sp. TaxID=1931995 RepID=UPI002FE3D0EB
MNRNSMSLILVQALFAASSLATIIIPEASEPACTKYAPHVDPNQIREHCRPDHVETEQDEKDKEMQEEIEKWYQKPPKDDSDQINRESPRPRFKIRQYDACVPGLESIRGCDSNPDIKPCADGTYPIVIQVYSLEGDFLTRQNYCPGDPLPPNVPKDQVETEKRIVITPEKFRTYPIKGSEIQSAPNKFSLRNGHTHFWASENTQEFNSNLSGSNVRIKAIPIQWNWNYGDGATRNLGFPGEAMPSHTLHDETATSHSYSETGKFDVRVTTLYRGEFSVDGGPWQAIPGQAAVPSNTLPIDVWRTKKELIAND